MLHTVEASHPRGNKKLFEGKRGGDLARETHWYAKVKWQIKALLFKGGRCPTWSELPTSFGTSVGFAIGREAAAQVGALTFAYI